MAHLSYVSLCCTVATVQIDVETDNSCKTSEELDTKDEACLGSSVNTTR